MTTKTIGFTMGDARTVAKQTAICNPHAWRVEPWDGQGKSGFLRLHGVSGKHAVLLWRKPVGTLAEQEAIYMGLNHYLLSRKDNQGIRHIDNETESVELTDAQLAQLEAA